MVVSFPFKDPGSGIVPDAISLHNTTQKHKKTLISMFILNNLILIKYSHQFFITVM